MTIMINGRTYRNVPTTNNTEPIKPEYPAVRTPAKGPVLTTANVEPKFRVEIDPNAGPGPAKFVDDAFKADVAEAKKKPAEKGKGKK